MDPVTRLRELESRIAERGEDAATVLALARTWRRLDNPRAALPYARRAVELAPEVAGAWNTLGALLMDLEHWQAAEGAFRHALKLAPTTPHAEENLALALAQQAWAVHRAAQCGDWGPYAEHGERLLALHRGRMQQRRQGLVAPFSVLGFHLGPAEQRHAAETQARAFVGELGVQAAPASLVAPGTSAGDRLRVGYLSADFRNNAAGHLLHRLFAAHDRERFEIHALSYGPEDGSEFRREIKAGVEHFVELRDLDDEAAAAQIRERGIDLLVDLMGFAGNHRAGILARRPAPRQVLWLGYCMTTGAPWIDAFLADEHTVPPGAEEHFSEPVVRLPDSYQLYSGQSFDRSGKARSECDLPEGAMVYCCFNMPEKVDPRIWDRWMAILEAVPDSVLWLLCGEPHWTDNYRKRAATAGVDPQRIIPAPLLPKRRHLERLVAADLFLDTTLCNAHTTASDALWAGVPVLTCPGDLFAQRVAASVCRAAGLPDLVVDDLDEYTATAIELGRDPQRLHAVKRQLDDARDDAPLFDVPGFARKLEAAFETIAGRRRSKAVAIGQLPVVLVLGTWRSGTSALAGVLRALGVHFGDDFGKLPADRGDQRTWEAHDLLEILWASLREPDMEPLRPIDQTMDALFSCLVRHEQMARQAGAGLFGLKHPGLGLLVPQIRERWPQVLTLRTERDIETSLDSMRRAGWEWPEAASRIGLTRQHEAAVANNQGPVFAFPALLDDPADTIERVVTYLELEPTRAQRESALASLKPRS